MAEYCSNCFEKLDALHMCSQTQKDSSSRQSGAEIWKANQSIGTFVMVAPLAGIILDLVVPLPSSILHSSLMAIFGSAISSAIWLSIKYEGRKNLKFFLRNIKNFLYTPNLIKIFGSQVKRNALATWLAVVVASAGIQLFIFTPGNSTYLSGRVSAKIDEASGANLSVDCPNLQFYFYNKKMECRVKTGLLGITVPARVKLSPLLGTSKIKISLF